MGIAIAFTVKVMTPTDVSWQQVVKARRPALARMIKKEPALLYGCTSIAAFEAERQKAVDAFAAASAAATAKPLDRKLRQARTEAEEECDSLNEKAERLTVLAMYAETQRKLTRAFVAMFFGGAVAVLGIVGFAWATNQSEDPAPTAAASAVPKRPSAVSVDLSAHGIEVLTKRVGDACSVKPLRAIALGGEPDALDLVSTPTATCATTRFTLTENMGTVVSDETVALPKAGVAP